MRKERECEEGKATSGQCWKLLTLVDMIVNTLKNICRYVSLNFSLEKKTGLLGYHGVSQSAKKTW